MQLTQSTFSNLLLIKSIRRHNAMEVREELFRLRMSTTEYNDYMREFIDLWIAWIQLLGGIEDE